MNAFAILIVHFSTEYRWVYFHYNSCRDLESSYLDTQVVTMFQAKKRKSKTASVKTAGGGSKKSEPSVEKKVEVPKVSPQAQPPLTTKSEGVEADQTLQEQTVGDMWFYTYS